MASEAWTNEYFAKLHTLNSIEVQAKEALDKLKGAESTNVPVSLTATELHILASRIKAQEDFLEVCRNPQ